MADTTLPSNPDVPVPQAANVWRDQPGLFERLRRRLASYAPDSQRAFDSDWRVWRGWCKENHRVPFPARANDLVEFVLAHSPPVVSNPSGVVFLDATVQAPNIRAASTVQRWLASVSALHRVAGVSDPTKDEDVRAVRRLISRGRNAPAQKAPLHWSDVESALSIFGESLRDLRDKALLCVAYSTMGRRTELVGICVEHLTLNHEGTDGSLTLKTKGGDWKERYVAPAARAALQRWLTAAGITEGPVFRRLERNGRVGPRTLNSAEVGRTFKRIAARLDLDASRAVSNISAHSTRIGATQDLTAAGAGLPEIMLAGVWKSPQMPAHYARKILARQGAMFRLLGGASAGDPTLTPRRRRRTARI